MKVESIPSVYARALLDLALEKGELERIRDEVAFLEGMNTRTQELRIFWESPRIPRSEKKKVIEKALRGNLSDHLLDFLLLVFDKGRHLMLRQMLAEFGKLYDQHIGLLRARVTTAVPMSDHAAEALRQRLARSLRRERVVLERRVDEDILGGFVLRYDGMVADASLKTALDSIEARMLAPQLGSELIHEG